MPGANGTLVGVFPLYLSPSFFLLTPNTSLKSRFSSQTQTKQDLHSPPLLKLGPFKQRRQRERTEGGPRRPRLTKTYHKKTGNNLKVKGSQRPQEIPETPSVRIPHGDTLPPHPHPHSLLHYNR
ncbi:unnamed protein product [Leuciscus chuanchicus]